MLKKLMLKIKQVVVSKRVAAGGGLMLVTGQAMAASTSEFGVALSKLICSVAGSSSITMFAGGAAIICFLVMFTLGEGKDHLSTLLKVGIGVTGLIALPGLIQSFWPSLLACGSELGSF